MKVLFQNRKKEQWIGGDMVQMEKTMDGLKDQGIDVTFNDQPLFTPALLLSDYDIVHLWNFSMAWTKFQVWAAKRQNRKIVCSMIYHETEAFVPYEHQQIMVDSADACIFLTEGEVERARRRLKIPEEKIHIIPNGIDELWLKEKKQKYGKSGYALTVGRIEKAKGQYEVAIACKRLGIPYLCVGEVIDEMYAGLCESEGAILLKPRSHKELLPLYDNARLFILASQAEIFPLTVMEAGARGLHSVVTDHCEWKDIPNVTWCKNADVESIEDAIQESLKIPKNSKFKTKLKNMTWNKVGKQVLEIYKTLWQPNDQQKQSTQKTLV